MTTPYPVVYSVCGYHPTTGDLAYANYAGFLTREAAIAWKSSDAARSLPLWVLQEITEHRATAADVSALLAKAVSDDMVESVEAEVGMGSAAWDMVNPKEIIAAAVKVVTEATNA